METPKQAVPTWIVWDDRKTPKTKNKRRRARFAANDGADLDPIRTTKGGFDNQSLVEYAVRCRIELLGEREWYPNHVEGNPASVAEPTGAWGPSAQPYNHNELAALMGTPPSTFSNHVNYPATSPERIAELDRVTVMFAYQHRNATPAAIQASGRLVEFCDEMIGNIGKPDPSWTRLGRLHGYLPGPHNSAEALVLAQALIGLLQQCSDADAARSLWKHHQAAADRTVRAIVAIASRPPHSGSVPAIQLAAMIGEPVLRTVEEHVEHSALGFRTIRILTRMLLLTKSPPRWWWASKSGKADSDEARIVRGVWEVRVAIWKHLKKFCTSDWPTPYPGRSFLIEPLREAARLASTEPMACPWSFEEITGLLKRRFLGSQYPRREQVHAAYVLGEISASDRAWLHEQIRSRIPDDDVWAYMDVLFEILNSDDGLSLEQLILKDIASLNSALVARGIQVTEITLRQRRIAGIGKHGKDPYLKRLPTGIQQGTRQLIRYAVLSPDGTSRRKACEALRAAGVTLEAAGIIANTLLDHRTPDWMQEACAFVLGLLGHNQACPALIKVAEDAARSVPTRHAALWALGDIRTRHEKTIELALLLTGRVDPDCTKNLPLVHAATYVLATLQSNELDTQHASAHSRRLSSLIDSGPDVTTRRLARWGHETQTRWWRCQAIDSYQDTKLWELGPLI